MQQGGRREEGRGASELPKYCCLLLAAVYFVSARVVVAFLFSLQSLGNERAVFAAAVLKENTMKGTK